jgi:2-polyprenyl-3-methyl-5-hydroxy-6-metoxy-1,4-benzoquinol methylase
VSAPGVGKLKTVHLLQLPVPLAARSRQWFEELMREFALIHAGSVDDHESRHVPARLMDMVDALTSRFAGVDDEPRKRLETAIDRGDRVMPDHVMDLPVEAAPATRALGDMLDEADEYCRQGQHLLTLAPPDDLLDYRRWYLSQIADQLHGAPPTPWPEYRERIGEATAVNRRYWDAMAAVHGNGSDAYYDVDALQAGESSMTAAEELAVRHAVGDVRGLDVLHVQCHIGFDSVTLARRGARVTGVDLSAASLEKARQVAQRCGVAVDFLQGDAMSLPQSLHGRFDLAYATIGVLCWIGDIDAWMRSVAATLRPGGKLVLVDIHPLYNMLASAGPLRADFPYGFTGPIDSDEDGSYADPTAELAATGTRQFAHSLGEVVTASVAAGLRVQSLHEHLESEWDPRGGVLTRDDDGVHRLRLDDQLLPVLFTLVAAAV